MKPTYAGYEGKNTRGGVYLPPVGQYIAEIQGVRMDKSYDKTHDEIVLMIEITEGEFAGQYHKVFENQKERFGGYVKYKGVFKLRPPIDGDEPWVKNKFEANLWCVQESNPGYVWDWDESKLKGKKIGINVRENNYTGNDGKPKTTTEIGQLETIEDVRDGKCKDMKPRGAQQKANNTSSETENIGTDVTNEVEVPF